MTRLHRWAACLMLAASPLLAPAQAPAAMNPPQAADLFDFWLGDWDVSWSSPDGSTGRGRNRIAKVLDGTVIEENFEETPDGKSPPLKGRSLSVLHKASGVWKQTWADNQGGYFSLTGQVDGERRIFITDTTMKDGKPTAQRMVFHGIRRDALTWDWEKTEDGGRTWQLLWRIHYKRRGA